MLLINTTQRSCIFEFARKMRWPPDYSLQTAVVPCIDDTKRHKLLSGRIEPVMISVGDCGKLAKVQLDKPVSIHILHLAFHFCVHSCRACISCRATEWPLPQTKLQAVTPEAHNRLFWQPLVQLTLLLRTQRSAMSSVNWVGWASLVWVSHTDLANEECEKRAVGPVE